LLKFFYSNQFDKECCANSCGCHKVEQNPEGENQSNNMFEVFMKLFKPNGEQPNVDSDVVVNGDDDISAVKKEEAKDLIKDFVEKITNVLSP